MFLSQNNPFTIYHFIVKLKVKILDHIFFIIFMLGLIVLVFSNFSAIGFGNNYYAVTVKNMIKSAQNFFFASYDPYGNIACDKPAPALWLQGLSALIFGFNQWSILIPQIIAYLLCVIVLYFYITGFFDKISGLTTAIVFAFTPIVFAVSRTGYPDNYLMLVLLLSSVCLSLFLHKHGLKWFLLGVVCIGIGFNIKYLNSIIIIPVYYLIFWMYARYPLFKKILYTGISGILLLLVCLAWLSVVYLVPSNNRPFIDATYNNSPLELLAITFNLLSSKENGITPADDKTAIVTEEEKLFIPNYLIYTRPSSGKWVVDIEEEKELDSGTYNLYKLSEFFYDEIGFPGFFRLFLYKISSQVGWLILFAIFSMAFLIYKLEDFDFSEAQKAIIIMWSLWLIVLCSAFSFTQFYHRYNLIILAPALSIFTGLGFRWSSSCYLHEKNQASFFIFPLLIIFVALHQFSIISFRTKLMEKGFWLVLIIGGLLAFYLLGSSLLPVLTLKKRYLRYCLAAGFVCLLALPFYWTITTIIYGDNVDAPQTGPELKNKIVYPVLYLQADKKNKLYQFLKKNNNNEKYLVAVPYSFLVSDIILKTDESILPIAGFTGMYPVISREKFISLVNDGSLRYVILSKLFNVRPEIEDWIKQNARQVPVNDYYSRLEMKLMADYLKPVLYDCRPGSYVTN